MLLGRAKELWEARRDSVRTRGAPVARHRLTKRGQSDTQETCMLFEIWKYDGYTVAAYCDGNIAGFTSAQHNLFSTSKGKHALIICPDGHFNGAAREQMNSSVSPH